MSLTVSQRTIHEGSTATYQATLKTEAGTPIAFSDIQTITLTYYNCADFSIINSRDEQNVKNANDVTISAAGVLTWKIRAEDTVIVAGTVADGETEKHTALFEFTWGNTFHGSHQLDLFIQQVQESPLGTAATLVSSWGGTGDNCYLGLTAANSYITWSVIDNDAWKEAATEKKVAALLEATRDIDSKQYLGRKKYTDQRLEFPRTLWGNFPWDQATSVTLSEAEERMQLDVQRAVCHQALWLLQNSGRNKHSELASSGVRRMERQVGPVRESYDYQPQAGTTQRSICTQAMAFLTDWLSGRRAIRG